MADPITLIAVGSLAASVAGAGISAYGAKKTSEGNVQTANANADAATYQAQVAVNNQKIASQNAQFALASGRQQSQVQDLKTGQTLGQQKAAQAAGGLDVNSGSNLDVRMSTEEIGRLDTLTIMNNAMRSASGYMAQGSNYGADSTLDTMKASNYKQAAATGAATGDIGVASSLLGGASSFSDKWLNYSQKGVPGF